MAKKGLGRGLGSLMGDYNSVNLDFDENENIQKDTGSEIAGVLKDLDINKVIPNPRQPRRNFDEQSLQELRDSIELHGLLTPLLVVPMGDKYEIVAGERRFRVCSDLGLKVVPCLIKQLDEKQTKEIALIDNLMRDDLNAIEISEYLSQLVDEYGYKQEELAQRIGVSRPQVANYLRLSNLEEPVKQLVIAKKLSYGHAKSILGINDPEKQILLAEKTVLLGLSVQELERLIKTVNSQDINQVTQITKQTPNYTHELNHLSNRFKNTFETNVSIKGSDTKGKITIEYNNKADLDRFAVLVGLLEQI